jgi:RsiW-degrading membrane proteinase PrsW (M82 family)
MTQSTKWTRALVESLAALLLCIVIVGMFFLPHEFQQRQKNIPKKHVVSCCLSQDATTVLALVATEASAPPQQTHSSGLDELRSADDP